MKSKILFFAILIFSMSTISCRHENKSFKLFKKESVTRKINVILYDNFPEKRANYFITELKKIFPEVEITKVNEPLPESAWYAPRNRYLAIKILDYMKPLTPGNTISLGFTDKDISQMRGKINWGIIGLSYKPGKTVIISTYRLNKKKTYQQGVKLCLHELAHAEGLDHCEKAHNCILRAAKGKNHFDELTGFCKSCSDYLTKKGWKLQ